MLGFAVGQLFYGPLSDRYGRRRTLIWSILIYSIATGLVFVALALTQTTAANADGIGVSDPADLGHGVDRVFGHCEGYPAGRPGDGTAS